jgi:hypothetical protein
MSNKINKEKDQSYVLQFYEMVEANNEYKSPKGWDKIVGKQNTIFHFEFEILYKKGNTNQVVDRLLRKVGEDDALYSNLVVTPKWISNVQTKYVNNIETKKITSKLKDNNSTR